MRDTFFRALSVAMLLFAPGAAMASGDLLVPSVPPAAAPSNTAAQTIRLTHAKPSDVILTLRQNVPDPTNAQPKSGIPAAIRRISYNDVDKTITVLGSAEAVAELKAVLALMDVKPQYIDVKARLVEVRLREDGTRQEILREASNVTVLNNHTARVPVGPSRKNVMNLSVAPRLNGDNSISITALLETRYFAAGPAPQRFQTSGFSSSVWLTKRSEWKTLREVSLVDDTQLQKGVLMGTKTPNSVYPLYRWEITATEHTDMPIPQP